MQFAINGQQSVSYDVTVQFTILGRDQEIVDQLQEGFSAKYGRTDDGVARIGRDVTVGIELFMCITQSGVGR